MTAYRVLVAHRDLKMKSVIELEPTEQVRFLVEAGYLREMDGPTEVAGTGFLEPPVEPPKRRGRPRRKPEVSDVEGGTEPDSGPDVREA
jgi:hypothetical protein